MEDSELEEIKKHKNHDNDSFLLVYFAEITFDYLFLD